MNSSSLHATDVTAFRHPSSAIESLLLDRWSPRAMSGEEITDEELRTLFEAARWAPSSGNSQPWRFVFAKRGTAHWDAMFDLLTEGNRRWASRGAVLVVVVSMQVDARNGKSLRTHSYDTGAAWQNLALQGRALRLVVHGMQGFDYDRARSALGIPDSASVEAMLVVGRPGSVEELPEELRKREFPSDRRPVGEFAFEGVFVQDSA